LRHSPSKEAEVAGILKAEVVGNIHLEAVAMLARRLAAVTSPRTGPLHLEAQLRSSAVAAQFRHNAGMKEEAAKVASKGVHPFATSKAIQKLLTCMLKTINGSVMKVAATMLVTTRITFGNTDTSAVKLAATTFIVSKAEAGTVSGLAAFFGASRLTTTTTPAIGCGTATTS
jgi:hypothetical protein